MKVENTRTVCAEPPRTAATSAPGCTRILTEADANVLVAVFITTTVSEKEDGDVNENGGNRNTAGSVDAELILTFRLSKLSTNVQEYVRSTVETVPEQAAV